MSNPLQPIGSSVSTNDLGDHCQAGLLDAVIGRDAALYLNCEQTRGDAARRFGEIVQVRGSLPGAAVVISEQSLASSLAVLDR